MRNFKERNKPKFHLLKFFVILFFFLFLFTSYAYSSYTSTLDAKAEAVIQKYIYDYVYITNVKITEVNGMATSGISHLNHEVNLSIYPISCGGYTVYEIEILNKTDYKAYITKTSVLSVINQNGQATNGYTIEFLDVTENETFIKPHETLKIKLKITNNCTTSDEMINIKSNFEYSLVKTHNLVINAIPNNAEIKLTTPDGTFTSIGSITKTLYEEDSVSYTISLEDYKTQTGTYKMENNDKEINVELIYAPKKTITVIPSVQGEVTYCSANGENLFYTTDYTKTSAKATVGDKIKCEVAKEGSEYYYTYDESTNTYLGYSTEFTLEEDVTLTPVLKEKPYINGTYSNTSSLEALNGNLKNYHSGYYLVELWGGKGGDGLNTGKQGKGGTAGYVYGVVYLTYEQVLNYSIGGNGTNGSGPILGNKAKKISGGANGGGIAAYDDSYNATGGSGGGYSVLSDSSTSTKYFIAAGGGGGGGPAGAFGLQQGGNGGNGGNINGNAISIDVGVVFKGTDGLSSGNGTAGSTTFGTNSKKSAANGSSLLGGNGYGRGGGGGAGYFGGAGGYSTATGAHSSVGGAGGGSSLINSSVQYQNLPDNVKSMITNTNPSSTGGSLIIKFIGKTL